MTDKEFDLLLTETIDTPPPNELAEEFTPWNTAMRRIIWGTGWTTLTLNVCYLDVILPAVGWMMLLLGYRTLRRENPWFRLGYFISWLRLLWFLFGFSINATIYASHPTIREFITAAGYAMVLPYFLNLLSLRNGIRSVQKKVGLPPHGGNGLLIWYLVFLFLALGHYQGLLGWMLIIVEICLLSSLFPLSKELDEAGYAVTTAPVRISDDTAKRIYAAVLSLSLIIGFTLLDNYPMDWKTVTTQSEPELQAIRQELLDLGVPEQILMDLTHEDLLACQGARRILIKAEDHPINSGRQVEERDAEGAYYTHTEYDQKELRITSIALELPGEKPQWRIIHHFQWVIDPGFHGTEAIQLWPAYRRDDVWYHTGTLTGQVLHNHNGQTYSSPFYSLAQETYTQQTIFWGAKTSTDVFAEFSFPNHGENHRGYISYTISPVQDIWSIDSWINYTHQTSWLQFPVITAKEKHRIKGVGDTLTFKTIQDALQVFPVE